MSPSARIARTLSTKVLHESGTPRCKGRGGGDPKAHGPPDGRGLLQVELQFHPELRHLDQWLPIENGISALRVYRKQGIGAWYAPSTAPGRIKPKLTR